jgi:transcriptional regulator with XRE-family HTH domain
MDLVKPMLKLRASRLRLGLTQTDLAYKSRLSASDVSRFENGMSKPYPAQAQRLAAVLGIAATELLDDSGEVEEVRSVR